MSERCKACEKKGFITESPKYQTPEGGTVIYKWCSNVHCDYNIRIHGASTESKKFIEENMTE